MISPEGVAAARRQLGRQLAALRKAAGYRTQHEFAPLTFYTRSTLANAETGRQRTGRAFWQRCDELLCTGGVLADGYDRIEAMVAQQQEETAQSLQVDNPAGSLSSLPGGCELSWSVDLGEALGEAQPEPMSRIDGERSAGGAGRRASAAGGPSHTQGGRQRPWWWHRVAYGGGVFAP